MDWSKIERLVHQQHENSFARSTGSTFSGQQPFASSGGSHSWYPSLTRTPEHEVHVNQRSSDVSYLRPPPPSDNYQHGLIDDVTSLRKGLYDAFTRINELQEGQSRQANALRQKEELENRMEEMERKLAVTSQHLSSTLLNSEQLHAQSRRLQSQVEDLHKLSATLQESSVSKEIFSKLLDSQRIENKQLQGEMTQNTALSRSLHITIQQLLRTICSFGQIEAEKLDLLTSNSMSGGSELFMHQLGDILLQSLQHGVDMSVSQHVLMLKSTLNTAIANLLNEFKTRQLAAMQPHFDRMQTIQAETTTTQKKVVEVESDLKTLHAEVQVNAGEYAKQQSTMDMLMITSLPPPAPPVPLPQALQDNEEFKLMTQELQLLSTQQASHKAQLTQLFSEQQALTQLIADSQKSTVQTQNLRFSNLESQIAEISENTEFSKRLLQLENRLSEFASSAGEKNREFVDRMMTYKHELSQVCDLQNKQKVDLLSTLENRVLLIQEETRVSHGKLALEVNAEIREKFRLLQSETHTLVQANNSSKTEGIMLDKGEDKSQLFHDQIKQLQLEIDTLQSRLLSSHDEFRVLMTTRDSDLVSRVNDRISHVETLKADFFQIQKLTLQELENKLTTLSSTVQDLSTTQQSHSNHILEEKLELLIHDQETLKTRLLATQQALETNKNDLLNDLDKLEKSLQRQLQTQENRLLTTLNTIDSRMDTVENSLQKVTEKANVENEKHLENLGLLQAKLRSVEGVVQKQRESVVRLENRLQTTETDLQHAIDTKTQVLEQRLLTQLQSHKLEFSSQQNEANSKQQIVLQKVDFLTTHYENKCLQLESKIEENYATQSRLFIEGESTHQSHQNHVLTVIDELKTHFTSHLSTIALQQEQLSTYIEKLDLTTSQKTLLLETEGIATRNINKAEINKVAKGLHEVTEELKFDVSHVNNRLMILEQQVNFADASSASSASHQQQQMQQVLPSQQQSDPKVLATLQTLQKGLASQQEQLQVLQEELVTLDTNHSNHNGKLETVQGQLAQLQQAQQQLQHAQQQLQQAQQQLQQTQQAQQQQLQRTSSSSTVSYAAESKQPPPRSSPTSPKPGAVSGPPISAIAAFMSPQQQPQPVKALNPAVARAMAADPRVMTQSAAPAPAGADSKGPASNNNAMLTPAKASAPSSSRQQQQPVHHQHHGAVLLSPMTTSSTSATSTAANVISRGSSSLHPSPPSAVKNAANVSPRPRLSPPAGAAGAPAPAAIAVPVARRFHPNQEEEEEDNSKHDHTKQQQAIDERNFESDDEDPPLHLLDEVMKKNDSNHTDADGPETSSRNPPLAAATAISAPTNVSSNTATLHLTKAAPPSVDPSATVMTSAASFPKTPPKHPQSKVVAEVQQEKLSIETSTAVAAPIPIQPFSPAQPLTPGVATAPQLQRTLSAGSNSSTTSSASKFSRRFNEASMTPPPTNSSRRSDSFDEDEAAHMLSGSFEGIALNLGSGIDDEFVSDSESENERSGVLLSLPGSAVKPTVFTGVGAFTDIAAGKSADIGATVVESKVSSSDAKNVVSVKPTEVNNDAKSKAAPQAATVIAPVTSVVGNASVQDKAASNVTINAAPAPAASNVTTNAAPAPAASSVTTNAAPAPAASSVTTNEASAPAPAVIVSGSLLGRGGGGIQRK